MDATAGVVERDDFWVGDVALVDVVAHQATLATVFAALVLVRFELPTTVASVVLFGGLGVIGAVRFAGAWILTERDARANCHLPRAPGPVAGPLVAALLGAVPYLLWRAIAIGGALRWVVISFLAPAAVGIGAAVGFLLLV